MLRGNVLHQSGLRGTGLAVLRGHRHGHGGLRGVGLVAAHVLLLGSHLLHLGLSLHFDFRGFDKVVFFTALQLKNND